MATKPRKLIVFNNVSLDGYFVDSKGDMSWAHSTAKSDDWNAYNAANAKAEGILVFGRITYDLMAGFWPTPMAQQVDAAMAAQMNRSQKVVFSKTMDKASWNNTRLVKTDLAGEMQKMKQESDKDILIFGSGTLVSQLAPTGLVDEYQLIMIPVILGGGRTMFEGIKEKIPMTLKSSRAFSNGNVILCYDAVGK
ncbi:MAG TPA: dihydrofolate reductase family protein [Chitinophagaceae bacterium]